MPFLLNKAGKQCNYGRWRADTLCAYTGPWSLSSKYPHFCSCAEQSRIYHLSFTFVHSESIDCVADVFIPEMRIVWILSDVSLEDSLKLCIVIQGPLHQDRKVHFSGNYIFSHFSKEHIFLFMIFLYKFLSIRAFKTGIVVLYWEERYFAVSQSVCQPWVKLMLLQEVNSMHWQQQPAHTAAGLDHIACKSVNNTVQCVQSIYNSSQVSLRFSTLMVLPAQSWTCPTDMQCCLLNSSRCVYFLSHLPLLSSPARQFCVFPEEGFACLLFFVGGGHLITCYLCS